MNSDKYLKLKRIYARVYHLTHGFPTLLTEKELLEVQNDPLKIAELEEQKGLLSYIKVSYQD